GHQTYVRAGTHGCRIKCTVLTAEIDGLLINAGVAAVRDHRQSVLTLAPAVPHLATVTDHGRHGGIDDHIAGHVQVGDAFVGVHHGQLRLLVEYGLDVSFNCRTLVSRQGSNLGDYVAEAVVHIYAQCLE